MRKPWVWWGDLHSSCFKYSSNIKDSHCKYWFFYCPFKNNFYKFFLPHVSWAFFLAFGTEGQPCNVSKKKPGSVLSPETYKGVRTEPLCLSCFWEREYTALLLSAGTEPGSLVRKAVGARTNSIPHGLPVVAYKWVWGDFLFLPEGTMPLARLG